MHRRRRIGSLAVFTLLATTLCDRAANRGVAQEEVTAPLVFSLPDARISPQLDGRIAAGEWDDASALSGLIDQFDRVVTDRPVTFWIKRSRSHLLVAQRSRLEPGEITNGPRQQPIWFQDNDNSIAFGLAPPGRDAATPHYQFRANVRGRQWQQQVRWSVNGLPIRYPQNTSWKSAWSAANWLSADQQIWESEYAVPLEDLRAAPAPEAGADWRVLLARDYPSVVQTAIVVSNDWRFGEANRHWSAAVYDNYRLEKRYAVAHTGRDVPGVQVLNLDALPSGLLDVTVRIASPRREPLDLRVACEVAQGASVVYRQIEQVTAPPRGESRIVRFGPRRFDVGAYSARIQVTSADRAVVHEQEVPFRVHATQLPRPTDVYFSGGHKEGEYSGALLPVYNPIRNTLLARVNLGELPGRGQAARVDVAVRAPGGERPIATMDLPPLHNGIAEREAEIAELPPGVYEAAVRVWSATGTLLARARELFLRFDHQKELPWLGNRIGISDGVLPNWTPIEVSRDGGTFAVSGRSYRVDGTGLPAGIAVAGLELLASPVRIDLISHGSRVALASPAGAVIQRAAPHAATFGGTLTAPGWTIATRTMLEYDGYLRFAVTIAPDGRQSMDSLKLRIPLRPEHATHLHAVGYNMRDSVSSIALPAENGPLWHSGQQRNAAYRIPMTAGNFKPFVWTGSASRGLAFMADNDRGWVPDDTLKVPAIEVERTEGSVDLILNLVARPFTFTAPREIVFSLQATPVRPLPEDFRQRITRTGNTLAFPGVDDDSLSWDGTFSRDYLQGGAAFPLSWEKNRRFRQQKEGREGLIYTPYQAVNEWKSVLEVDDPRAPGLQGANLYGYLANEWTASLSMGDAAMTATEADYRVWRYERWINESGLSGFYFDNAYPALGTNVRAGQGYVLDLPDRPALHGRIQPGYLVTGLREFFKRLRTVLVAAGKEPLVLVHATDSYVVSAFAFADDMIDGENAWMRPDAVFAEVWPAEHLQTLGPSAKWGLGTYFLAAATKEGRFSGDRHFEHMLGYLMLHDLDVWETHYFWNVFTKDGLDLSERGEFLPYWDVRVSSALQGSPEAVRASGWRQGDTLFVVAFNRSWSKLPAAELDIDLAALRMAWVPTQSVRVRDIRSSEMRSAAGGAPRFTVTGSRLRVQVDIEPQMWRVLRIDLR